MAYPPPPLLNVLHCSTCPLSAYWGYKLSLETSSWPFRSPRDRPGPYPSPRPSFLAQARARFFVRFFVKPWSFTRKVFRGWKKHKQFVQQKSTLFLGKLLIYANFVNRLQNYANTIRSKFTSMSSNINCCIFMHDIVENFTSLYDVCRSGFVNWSFFLTDKDEIRRG